MSAIKVNLLPVGSSLTWSLSAAITLLAVSECKLPVEVWNECHQGESVASRQLTDVVPQCRYNTVSCQRALQLLLHITSIGPFSQS